MLASLRWLVLSGVIAHAATGALASGDTLRVLMVGHSFTQGNSSAPATYADLQGFFDASPTVNGAVINRSEGGATLRSHAEPDGATVALLVANAGFYDVIVLQERSDRPGRAIKFGGAQLTGLEEGGPVLIEDYIRVHQPQAEVVLFSTWARHPSLEPATDDDLATWFNDNPVEMQLFTNLGYEHIRSSSPAGDLSDITKIAPVGDAWRRWYDAYGYLDLASALHDTDGSHQNSLGSYLAAAVLFESITGERVTGSGYLGGVGSLPGGVDLAFRLQQNASATVRLVDLAGDYNADGHVDAADYTAWRDHVGAPAGALPNDADGGVIALAQYRTWRENYGRSSASVIVLVPEPSTAGALLVLLAAILGGCIDFADFRPWLSR